jgi:hypothetical protein
VRLEVTSPREAAAAVDLLDRPTVSYTVYEPVTPTSCAAALAPARPPAGRASRARDRSRWNDASERRREHVVALIDAAVVRTH